MPTIDIHRPHGTTRADALETTQKIATRMSEKLGTKGHWQPGGLYTFTGPGAKGSITVGDSEIHVVVELGMMLTFMKGTIEDEIRRKLEEHFGR
ncbi:MAG: hypothetical protein GAK28_02173 [Luteibacter sp.]|uniref:polyhydroxyalkanoic acid system family protein n=1 Tax=Luteibacter sp. TaxID=1886636 RepID=UPI001385D92A|nr:polyhydroxyalkanoic acid system family protein [Luteibacter sp.]KAF1006857.1 MAG: hypothetical protein GAK28_02173 [Luteibacter sp.]